MAFMGTSTGRRNAMKEFLVSYWITGSLLAGMALGWHDYKCPNDPDITMVEALSFTAIWPSFMTYGLAGGKAPVCKPEKTP
jgi:hypothetical protein